MNGPTILLDKSTFQLLSYEEILRLGSYYHVVHTPILFKEVLADIRKTSRDKEALGEETIKLSHKFSGTSDFTADYAALALNELLGHPIEMRGVPILPHGEFYQNTKGENVAFFDVSPHEKAIHRWQQRDFSEIELEFPNKWEKMIKSLNVEAFLKRKDLPTVRKKEALRDAVVSIADNKYRQKNLIEGLVKSLSQEGETEKTLFKTLGIWRLKGFQPLKTFAPYTYFILRVLLTFQIGVKNKLFGTRNTNLLDLEYILYMPFSKIFSTNDNFQKEFFQFFFRKRKDLIEGSELKKEINQITDYQGSLSAKEREKNFGYPPQTENSFTYSMWEKHVSTKENYIEAQRNVPPLDIKLIRENFDEVVKLRSQTREE